LRNVIDEPGSKVDQEYYKAEAKTRSGNALAERERGERSSHASDRIEAQRIEVGLGNQASAAGINLSKLSIGNIVFNETRSLSGPNIDLARISVANVVINGDQAFGTRRPLTASATVGTVPVAEQASYSDCQSAAGSALRQQLSGQDPTNGATHFNLRPNDSVGPFYGFGIQTHYGPFANSYPTGDLPASGIYVNSYGP
jgi:hypothetical protein